MPPTILPEKSNLFLASRNGLYTYENLDKFTEFFLQYLFDHNFSFQKPLGLLADSCDELVFTIAACWKLGIPFSCFSPNLPEKKLEKQINRIDPDLVFAGNDYLQHIDIQHKLPISQLNVEKVLSLEINLGSRAQTFTPKISEEQVFGYFFTSGTSNEPKIVPLKRKQMIIAAQASKKNFKPRLNHFWLLCLPLNHIGGVSIILRSLIYGSGIYRMKRFDVKMVSTFLSENHLFQAASLVPTMLKRLLENPVFQTHKNFKAILLGGGPVHTDFLKEAAERGVPVVSSYGMTETCAQIAANPLLEPSGTYYPLNSVGTIFKGNKIEIRDAEHNPLGINNAGNIWLKGPQLFDGYLTEDGIETKDFDDEGWFNTGDLGYLNANGHLFIKNRQDDLIITGGENVSPVEIEIALEKIEGVDEAGVTGIADREWGEKIVAFVVMKPGQQCIEKELQSALKTSLEPFKIPKQILEVPNLPHTDSGKLQRVALPELLNIKQTT